MFGKEKLSQGNSSRYHISYVSWQGEGGWTSVSKDKQDHPDFFICAYNRKFINSSKAHTNCRTISMFSKHFGQNTMAQTTHTPSINISDNYAHCGNVISSFNNSFNNSDEDAQILRWLSPLEPNIRHQGVRTGRFGGVGDWFLETSEFREWRWGENSPDKRVLFCSGDPGVGKTYLR